MSTAAVVDLALTAGLGFATLQAAVGVRREGQRPMAQPLELAIPVVPRPANTGEAEERRATAEEMDGLRRLLTAPALMVTRAGVPLAPPLRVERIAVVGPDAAADVIVPELAGRVMLVRHGDRLRVRPSAGLQVRPCSPETHLTITEEGVVLSLAEPAVTVGGIVLSCVELDDTATLQVAS